MRDAAGAGTGARELRAYLKERGQTVHAFCVEHGLSRIYVARVLKGERGQRISVDFACAIETATSGRVTCRMWRSRPARKAA